MLNKPSNVTLAVGLVTGAVLIASCSGGDAKASGLFDETKTKAATQEVSHREPKTKKKCTRRVKGVCKSSIQVPDGTKKVVDKPAKPALYCVELDDVNGDKDRDDEWFEVSLTTFTKYAGYDEGNKVTDMKYSVSGCSQ